MAPATLAGATSRAVRTRAGWDRDSIVNAIQEWVATYGEPPRAADWNPSAAKWSGQLWRVERYRAGRADGSPWPALNSVKRPFGGSLNEAIRAAGFEPATPGPKRRRDVDPEQASRAVISPEGRAMIGAALARAREAERARERARAELATARVDRAEARTAAERLAAKLERAEATVNTPRAERRELKADGDRLVAAVTGEPRRLTAAELAELRADGPTGPAVMAAALRALAKARAGGSRTELRAALTGVAQAAITWQERI